MISASDKTSALALALAVAVAGVIAASAGCASGSKPAANSPSSPSPASTGRMAPAPAPIAGDQSPEASPMMVPASTTTWCIVLLTFTGADHVGDANSDLTLLPRIAPQVRGARLHTTPKGSMIVYGNFASRDDPAAQAALQQIKEINYRGRKLFPRAMLTQLDLRPPGAPRHPHDLKSARQRFPKVDPLYTLDVAIWVAADKPDPRSGAFTYDECRRRAQAYAQQLRVQGLEAFFHHDDALQQSMVTVGLFDRRAIDSRSGFYSSDVLDLMRRFPARLFNGEPLQEYKDPKLKTLGTQPQQPKLVLVPAM